MKAGFKPKLLTKKEWQDNRSAACKGCGVGEALDQLQPFRNKSIAAMPLEDLSKANGVLGKLMTALQKAEGKCGPNQKETKAGIGEYKKIVSDYEKRLKAVAQVHSARAGEAKNAVKSLDEVFAKMSGDGAYREALIAYAKKQYFDETLDAWFLWKQKKYTDMIRKYGPKNDYNIPGPVNAVLMDVFVSKKQLTPEKLKEANNILTGGTMATNFTEMLWNDARQTRAFPESAEFKAYVSKKLPILDFKM